jgi:hypothetical protein
MTRRIDDLWKEGERLTLELDFILNNEGLSLVVDLLGKLGRDGVMSGGILDDETFVALHTLVDMGLLNSPFTNVSPFLVLVLGVLHVLLGMRWLPCCIPTVYELLDKVSLNGGRLIEGENSPIRSVSECNLQ